MTRKAPAKRLTRRTAAGEEVRREAALRASEGHLRSLIDGLGPAMFVGLLTPDGTVVEANQSGLKATGLTRGEVLGKPFADFWPWTTSPEVQQRVRDAIDRAARGEASRYDVEARAIGDRSIVFDFTLEPLRDTHGRVAFLVPSAVIVTGRRLAEAALRETALRLHTVLSHAPVAIFATDSRGVFTLLEGKGLERIGLKGGETVGQSADDLYGALPFRECEGTVTTGKEVFRRVLAGETVTAVAEFRQVYYEHRIGPLRGNDGEVVGTIGVLTDITEQMQADERVRKSERHLRRVLDRLPAMVGILAPDGTVLDGNRLGLETIGFRLQDAIGRPFADQYPWSSSPAIQARLRDGLRRAAGGEVVRYDEDLPTASGQSIAADLSIVAVSDETGRVTHLIASAIDVTERKRAYAALGASEARTRLLVRSANVGLWHRDLVTNDVFFSPEWKHQLGYADDELPNRQDEWERRLHQEDRAATLSAISDYIAGRLTDYDVEYRMRHRDGSWRWILSRADLVRDAAGTPVRMMGCHIDVTERRQAEQEVRRASGRLQALSRQLLEIRETERRQLARELHDEIGQVLSAAKINLQTLQRMPEVSAVAFRLDESVAIIDRAIGQVRARSLELHPPLLDDLGLTAALRWLTAHYAQNDRLHLAFYSAVADERFVRPVEIACFRLAQEAMTNIVRHAQAHHITVLLQVEGGRLHLCVHDDGVGFDVAAARGRAAQGASLGLLGMEERAALAGGTITWRSRKGLGTWVDAWFAVAPTDAVQGP